MNGESSSNGTPRKGFMRVVKGLLSLQQESPSQTDVHWTSSESPLKNVRTVGGKSKFQKSSNQLTPKNNVLRKKYYSSPNLHARMIEGVEKKTDDGADENKRILLEFQRQFSNENYVPRNLLENLTETLEDSMTVPDNDIRVCNTKINTLSDHEYDFSDAEDFDALAEIENQARQLLDKKSTDPVKDTNSKTDNKVNVQIPVNSKVPAKKPNVKETQKNNYFDSDDDDLIFSIPLEKLIGESSKTAGLNSNKNGQPLNNLKRSNESQKSVIPVKKQLLTVGTAKVQNSSNLKPNLESQIANNMKVCTAEEIAEKRRQAMLRREAYLENMRSQKSNLK